MERWLSKNSDFLYAVMRLIVGLLFACHGVQKLFGMLDGQRQDTTLCFSPRALSSLSEAVS